MEIRWNIIKICTINIPESYIGAINKLIGENGLFPSRSELIRVAVRDFLIKELKMAKNMARYNKTEIKKEDEDEDFVRVPIDSINEKSEPVREYKSYKIIKRLEDITSNSDHSRELRNHPQTTEYGLEDKEFPSFEEIEKIKPNILQLRDAYPDSPDFKYINERLT